MKNKSIFVLGCAVVAVLIVQILLSPAFAQDEQAGDNDLIPELPPYVIQPDDRLEVFVWKEPELTRTVTVRPDGRVSLPLIQDLNAAGRTPEELKNAIEERLKEYLGSPSVTVIVQEIRHYKVFVTGKVQKPGQFTSPRPISILQSLTLAGGFQEFADRSGMRVIRTYGREHVVFEFDYDGVIKGKKTQQNIILRSGDVVVVP